MIRLHPENARRRRQVTRGNSRSADQRRSARVRSHAHIFKNECADEKVVEARKRIERRGIRLDAVTNRLMLRDRPGVFVAGEMLDWEAPTGGYLLQACFSTGVAAAKGAVDWIASIPDER